MPKDQHDKWGCTGWVLDEYRSWGTGGCYPVMSGERVPSKGPGYPEKNIIQKDMCTPVFIVALFTIAQDMEAA